MKKIKGMRRTLYDKLVEAGRAVDVKIKCARCERWCLPIELIDVEDTPSIPEDDICGHCLIDIEREAIVEAEKAAKAEPQGWDTDAGANVRAQRSAALDASLWAVIPGTPLSENCQSEFCEYRKKLHRLTVDFDYPGDVVWPDQPKLVYEG